MKKKIIIAVILLIILMLAGCNEAGDKTGNEKEMSNSKNEATHTDPYITNQEFLKAIEQANPDLRISNVSANDLHLQRLKINHGTDYDVVWTEHSIPNSELPILVIFNEKKEPIYAEQFRERIESLKYIGESAVGKSFIEVTSYGASGSFSGQWVNLLFIDGNKVKNVWELQTISNESHFVAEESSMEYLHSYSSYVLLPTYQQRFTEQDAFKITAQETLETILVKDDEVISREKNTNELQFIWDEKQAQFVEFVEKE